MTLDERRNAAVTDPKLLARVAYGDQRHLSARQSLYRWQRPRYDLPGLVLQELAGTTGPVLDVGCGNGKFIERLRRDRPDLPVVGLDVSPGILAGVPGPVVTADASALPFADGTADAVLAMHMIYHVRDVGAAVTELARVLGAAGVLVASTNSDRDKKELDELWRRAAGDVLGTRDVPRRVSLSSRFSLEKAPRHLSAAFGDVRVRELPGVMEITDPAPVVAHLASYEAWAGESGVPFTETVGRAEELAADVIRNEGSFRITCLGGVLVCRR
ncbi:class I SAM-dependent methyltransferase [Streptomyces sp. NPDC059816]|uniref:class I SAM-dependent methyltransferase n=2 Tax=unclassified Streptomyces TaxID=2593676 RepID=UPI00364755E5